MEELTKGQVLEEVKAQNVEEFALAIDEYLEKEILSIDLKEFIEEIKEL